MLLERPRFLLGAPFPALMKQLSRRSGQTRGLLASQYVEQLDDPFLVGRDDRKVHCRRDRTLARGSLLTVAVCRATHTIMYAIRMD